MKMEPVTIFAPDNKLITPEERPTRGEIVGVPLHSTSIVKFYARVFYHVNCLEKPGDFPLADLDDPTKTNCDFGIVVAEHTRPSDA